MKSLCITLTSPFVLNAFLLGHISRLAREMHVTICLNTCESNIDVNVPPGVELISIEIRRAISPYHDFLAFWKLRKLYKDRQFSAVFTVTPKGGLLGMAASLASKIPTRVHCFTGQVWANKRGLPRFILKFVDRLIAASSSHLLADSPSQKDFLVSQGITSANSIQVLGHGSISGVDLARFRPDSAAREKIRKELRIDPSAICLLYAGRMKKEKGVLDLLEAFVSIRRDYPTIQMILVGPDEERLLGKFDIPGIHSIGYSRQIERYMAAADIFCLPSYREGFGSVLIEAAAAGLPSVASRIYGITDAVWDEHTGFLHEAGDVADIVRCLKRLIDSPNLREKMGQVGHRRAVERFSSALMEDSLSHFLCVTMRSSGSNI